MDSSIKILPRFWSLEMNHLYSILDIFDKGNKIKVDSLKYKKGNND